MFNPQYQKAIGTYNNSHNNTNEQALSFRSDMERPSDYFMCLFSALAYRDPTMLQTSFVNSQADIRIAHWQALLSSTDEKNAAWELYYHGTGLGNFAGLAFINKKTKALVITFRGTQASSLENWAQDAVSIVGNLRLNAQQQSAYRFVLAVLDKLLRDKYIHDDEKLETIKKEQGRNRSKPPALRQFQLYFTGHSLGAWLAAFFSVDFNAPCVLFESPGTRPALERFQAAARFDLDWSALDATVYYGCPNLINTLNPEIGTTYQIFPKEGEPEGHWFKHTKTEHSIENLLTHFNPETGLPYRAVRVLYWPWGVSTSASSIWERLTLIAWDSLSTALRLQEIGRWILALQQGYLLQATLMDLNEGIRSGYLAVTTGERVALSLPMARSPQQQLYAQAAGYKVVQINPTQLPFAHCHPQVQRFLKDFDANRVVLNQDPRFKSLPQNLQQSLQSFRITQELGVRSLYIELPRNQDARDFCNQLTRALQVYPDLLDIEYEGQRYVCEELAHLDAQIKLHSTDALLLESSITQLQTQVAQQEEAMYRLLSDLTAKHIQPRLYLYGDPTSAELKVDEEQGKQLDLQIKHNKDAQARAAQLKIQAPYLSQLGSLTIRINQEGEMLQLAQIMNQALTYFKRRRYADAQTVIQQALKQLDAAQLPEKFNYMAALYVLKGKVLRATSTSEAYHQTEACYKRALEFIPDNPTILSSLGALLDDKKDYTQAYPYHRKAVERNPYHGVTLANYGWCLYHLSQGNPASPYYHQALAIYQQSLEIEPNMAGTWLYRGIAHQKINHSQAIYDFTSGLSVQSNHPKLHYQRGLSYAASGRLSEAVDDLNKALALLDSKPVQTPDYRALRIQIKDDLAGMFVYRPTLRLRY